MSSFKSFVLLVVLLALSSCGFTPVYKQTVDSTGAVATDEFAAVEIIAPHNLYGQAFATNLSDLLNPSSKTVPIKYRLTTEVDKSESGLTIEQDRTTSRYKVTVMVKYTLTDVATGKVIDQGRIRRDGGYDRVESDYATYVSADDTAKRIIKELAADAKLKIISIIRR
ncbi:MAG: hypothetical protein K0R98_1267 [Rickettsiaceae bacterium]|jgi:hypothetical protein|nr:hypothetical protein [Rickettsiaceae bacterium]